MAFVYTRKRSPFWHYRVKHPITQKWKTEKTKFRIDDPNGQRNAKKLADTTQKNLNALCASSGGISRASVMLTVRAYALDTWIKDRELADLDWKNDRSRLEHHILPTLGSLPLASVGTPKIAALVHALRFGADTQLSQRTVYNVYSVIAALFRDAQIAGLIETSPCVLTKRQLGPLVDSDPLWRATAVFTREEAETLVSDKRIPLDRRVQYALGLLAGLRPGEIAALRVESYAAGATPLGQLTVSHALNTRKNKIKGTKTQAVRYVPVHPTLAAMLTEWLATGYAQMTGREPEPGDLLLPLPPKAAARRRSREGEPIRTGDYMGKRWREEDMPRLKKDLGWRYREMYDTKATFITLVLEDGADESVIRDRVTHAKPQRHAFDGYNRGLQWTRTCEEVAKLRVRLVEAPQAHVSLHVSQSESSSEKAVEAAGVEGEFRAVSNGDSERPRRA